MLDGVINDPAVVKTRARVAPKGCVKVIRVNNPMDLTDHEATYPSWVEGVSVIHYLRAIDNPKAWAISVSGELIEPKDWVTRKVKENDVVVIFPVPLGDDGKEILRLVAMIVIAVYAPWASGAILGAEASAAATMALTVGITVAGAVLVNALLPIQLPKANTGDLTSESPTYGIDGAKNTAQEGLPVPVCYGRFRMAGNVVSMHTENRGNNQYLFMLLNAGEGPIAGITEIEVNEQPIGNFSDAEVQIRTGTQDQTVMPWFDKAIVPFNRGVNLVNTNWVEQQTSGAIDRFRVDMVAPAGLVQFNEDGSKRAVSVEFDIEYKSTAEPTIWTSLADTGLSTVYETFYVYSQFWSINNEGKRTTEDPERVESTLDAGTSVTASGDRIINDATGRIVGYVSVRPAYSDGIKVTRSTTSAVRFSFYSPVLPSDSYDIRVRRTVAPDASSLVQDAITLTDFNEIQTEQIAYRNTALVGLKIRVNEQLSSIPTVTYENLGRLIRTRENGEWVTVENPSNNPAWVALDMLTNARYGGQVADERIEFDAWDEWAEYCDEKGLTFQGNFDLDSNLWDALQYVFRAGHAKPVRVGTRYSVAIERARDASMMFNSSAILEGSFSQSWIAKDERANEVEISYFDETDRFKKRTVKVYDDTVAAGISPKTASLVLIGVTNYLRATEEAIFHLKLNRKIKSKISFEAYLEAIAVTVGDVILLQHEQPNWSAGGRLAAGSTTSLLELDRTVTIGAGTHSALVHYSSLARYSGTVSSKTNNRLFLTGFAGQTDINRIVIGGVDYRVTRVYDDGVSIEDATAVVATDPYVLHETDAIEKREISSVAGDYTQVALTTPLPEAPAVGHMFMIGPNTSVTNEWRVVSIEYATDHTRFINVIQYDETVYDWTNTIGGAFQPPGNFNLIVPHVANLAGSESREIIGGAYQYRVNLTWDAPTDFPEYSGAEIYAADQDAAGAFGPYELVGSSNATSNGFEYPVTLGETVRFAVVAKSSDNREALRSTAPSVDVTVTGDFVAPAVPTGFAIAAASLGVALSWVNPTDADFDGCMIKRSTTNDEGLAPVVFATGRNQTSYSDIGASVAANTYYYWIASRDEAGNVSAYVAATPTSISPNDAASSGYVGFLTNESHSLAADSSGVVADFSTAFGEFKVFVGAVDRTADAVFSVVSQTGLTGTVNTATNTPATGPKGYYEVTAMSAATGVLKLRAVVDGVTIEKSFSLVKSLAGGNGTSGDAALLVRLSADSQVFTYDGSTGSDVAVPASQTIKFTASRQNIATAITWRTYTWNGSAWVEQTPAPGSLTSVAGDSASLTLASFGAEDRMKIRAEADGLFDEITVVRVVSGEDGAAGASGLSIAELMIFRRSASTPAAPTGGVYDFDTQALTTVPTNWSTSVPAGTDPVYVSRAVASVVGQTGTDSALSWSAVVKAFQDGAQGDTGVAGQSVDIVFRRSASQPATPAASSGTPAGWYSDVNSVPAGADPIWSSVGTKAGGVTNFTWQTPVKIEGLDGDPGTNGTNAISGYLTNEVHSVATAGDGTGYDLTNAGGSLKVFSGTTDVTASATLSVVGGAGSPSVKAQNGLTISLDTSTGVYTLSGASWTSDLEAFTLRAVYSGVTIDKQYSIVKSKSGSAGSSAAIVLSDHSVDSDPGGGTNGKAEYQLTGTGQAQKRVSGTASAFTGIETFLKLGNPADYEVECVVSGTNAGEVTGPTGSGVWYLLNAARLWVLEDTSLLGGAKTATLTLTIRHAVTQEVQDSAIISLTANKSN